jgi:hypothetical protein
LFQTGYIRRLAKLPPFLGDSISLIGTYEAGKIFFVTSEPSVPMDGGDCDQDSDRPPSRLPELPAMGPITRKSSFNLTDSFDGFYFGCEASHTQASRTLAAWIGLTFRK